MAQPQSRYSPTPTQPSVREADLSALAKSRVEEAEILLANGKYDAASYLCGYAVELALKIRICRNFRWSEYPPATQTSSQTGGMCDKTYEKLFKEFVKTHDLEQLLCLSGITKEDIKVSSLGNQWQKVAAWTPENRYDKIQSVSKQNAEDMIEAVKKLLKMFLGIEV